MTTFKNKFCVVIAVTVLVAVVMIFLGADMCRLAGSLVELWDSPIPGARPYHFDRDVGTYGGRWTNGYLGLFFRYRWFGFINMLALPLLVHFFLRIKRHERWEVALLCVYVFSVVIIGWKGLENERYAFTLVPFTVTFVLYELWKLARPRIWRVFVVAIVLLFAVSGYVCEKEIYYSYLDYALFSYHHDALPYSIIDYLQCRDVNEDVSLLCLAQPWVPYYSNYRTIDVLDGRFNEFARKLKPSELLDHIVGVLGVDCVITSIHTERTYCRTTVGSALLRMLDRHAILLITDGPYNLYLLTDKPYSSRKVLWISLKALDLVVNRSFEQYTNESMPVGWWFQCGANRPECRYDGNGFTGKGCLAIRGDNYNLVQSVTDVPAYRGETITLFAWLKTNVPDKYGVGIYDGKSHSLSRMHRGDGIWRVFRITHRVSDVADRLDIRAVQAEKTGKTNDEVCVDAVMAVRGCVYTLDDALDSVRKKP